MKNDAKITLPYAHEQLTFSMSSGNIAAILTPNTPIDIPDPLQEVLRALANPIGCSPLSELVASQSRVVIVSDDNTRLTPAHLIVPAMLEQLYSAGVKKNNIKIITALGTHRSMTLDEIKQKFGVETASTVEILNHDFRNPAVLHDFGHTENGTPIQVNKLVLEADVVIGIGSIVPHHIPGYSGGAKIIQPGICGEDTTAETHLLSVRTRRNMLGILENKVREEMEVIADKVGAKYVFNTVLDTQGRVIKAFFGDMRQAFRAGVQVSREVYGLPVARRTPIVVASSHPCDLEFWQAHKTLYPCDMLVEEGGMMIIVTPCPEGIAMTHPDVLKFANQSPEDIDQQIREGQIRDKVAGALALAWSKIRSNAEICLVSHGVDSEAASKLGFTHASSIEQALARAYARLGQNSAVTVLTHGADILPLLPPVIIQK
ncbi:MAG TPA: nickel-dependent lactate racemase [Desulfosporosinus sp.]|nr:nickel-dependent lactate racemase [Desulfosporosinus sp.]